MVPKLILLFTAEGWSAQPYSINLEFYITSWDIAKAVDLDGYFVKVSNHYSKGNGHSNKSWNGELRPLSIVIKIIAFVIEAKEILDPRGYLNAEFVFAFTFLNAR